MTKQEKIQAAQKRNEELRKLNSEWTKKRLKKTIYLTYGIRQKQMIFLKVQCVSTQMNPIN